MNNLTEIDKYIISNDLDTIRELAKESLNHILIMEASLKNKIYYICHMILNEYNVCDRTKNYILHKAALYGDKETTLLCINAPQYNYTHYECTKVAIDNGYFDVAQLLIEKLSNSCKKGIYKQYLYDLDLSTYEKTLRLNNPFIMKKMYYHVIRNGVTKFYCCFDKLHETLTISEWYQLFLESARSNDINVLKYVYDNCCKYLSSDNIKKCINMYNNSIIKEAAQNSNLIMIEFLVKLGANIKAHRNKVLYLAIKYQDLDIIEYFFNLYPNILLDTWYLNYAIHNDYVDGVKYIIQNCSYTNLSFNNYKILRSINSARMRDYFVKLYDDDISLHNTLSIRLGINDTFTNVKKGGYTISQIYKFTNKNDTVINLLKEKYKNDTKHTFDDAGTWMLKLCMYFDFGLILLVAKYAGFNLKEFVNIYEFLDNNSIEIFNKLDPLIQNLINENKFGNYSTLYYICLKK